MLLLKQQFIFLVLVAIFAFAGFPFQVNAHNTQPSYDMDGFWWLDDDSSATDAEDNTGYGTGDVAQETHITDVSKNTNLRLRVDISETANQDQGLGIQPRLEYQSGNLNCNSTGTWTTVTTATSTNAWALIDTSNITDGHAVDADRISGSNQSFQASVGDLLDQTNPASSFTLDRESGEWEWNIQATDNASDGQIYTFRVTNAGTLLNAYSLPTSLDCPNATVITPVISVAIEDGVVTYGSVQSSATSSTISGRVNKSAVLDTATHELPCVEQSSTNKIYCFGGNTAGGYTDVIFEYNPDNDTDTIATSTLPTARHNMGCAEDSSTGKIYCFGGRGASYYDTILEFDPSTDALATRSATLPTARRGLSCAENSATNRIFCFGGFNGTAYYDTILEYNPASPDTDPVAQSATLPAEIAWTSCAENSSTNNIYCFGGFDNGAGARIDSIFEYNPTTDALSTATSTLPSARSSASCAENSLENRIYCFGGSTGGSNLDEIVGYNSETDEVSTHSKTLSEVSADLACDENTETHRIYCFGGNDGGGGIANQIEEFIAGDTQIITNDGNVTEYFNIRGAATTDPGLWDLVATIGADEFRHRFATDGTGTAWVALTDSYQFLTEDITANGTQALDLEIQVPSSITNGGTQTHTITIQAVESGS